MQTICEFDKCGHLCCEQCITKINNICPICKTYTNYHISKYMTRELANCSVKCSVNGCNDIFSYCDRNKHQKLKHNLNHQQLDDISYNVIRSESNCCDCNCCDCNCCDYNCCDCNCCDCDCCNRYTYYGCCFLLFVFIISFIICYPMSK
jgi:hypothetical protein